MSKKKNFQSRNDDPKKMIKKVSVLSIEKIDYVDYKDVNLLNKFISDHAKIRNSMTTGNDVQQQREIAKAIKNAREMGLIAYTTKVTKQTKGRRSSSDRPDRNNKKQQRQEPKEVKVEEKVTVEDNKEEIVVETETVEEV